MKYILCKNLIFSCPLFPPLSPLPLSINPNLTTSQDYKAEEDPAKFKSVKTGRGPLGANWKVQFTPSPLGGRARYGWGSPGAGNGWGWGWAEGSLPAVFPLSYWSASLFLMQQELVNQKDCPYMCAYKLVTVKFKWWGLQNKVENFIHKVSELGEDCMCACVLVRGV